MYASVIRTAYNDSSYVFHIYIQSIILTLGGLLAKLARGLSDLLCTK